MISKYKLQRLSPLSKVPHIAALDHRHFLDTNGQDTRLSDLPRNERRRIKAAGKKIARLYQKKILAILKGGAGFPNDKLLHQLAVEYTHRYADSGLYTQPVSFNYFESFCDIKLFDASIAPYADPVPEIDHLFGLLDYFDYATSQEGAKFDLSRLQHLPEGRAYHFTPNGSIYDFTFSTAEGREFLIAGFSIVRRGHSLHWYLVGGEVLSEDEWSALEFEKFTVDHDSADLLKRKFLAESAERDNGTNISPVALEVT